MEEIWKVWQGKQEAVTQSHEGWMGEKRWELPTGSVVLNGHNDGSVSVGVGTMRLPDDLRENTGSLNQKGRINFYPTEDYSPKL